MSGNQENPVDLTKDDESSGKESVFLAFAMNNNRSPESDSSQENEPIPSDDSTYDHLKEKAAKLIHTMDRFRNPNKGKICEFDCDHCRQFMRETNRGWDAKKKASSKSNVRGGDVEERRKRGQGEGDVRL